MLRQIFSLSANTTDRLAWMDYAKGLAIAMVAFRHAVIGVRNEDIGLDEHFFTLADSIGVTFRMPLFFILSGVFFRMSIQKRGKIGYVWHKAQTILYPYVIWSLIVTTLQIVFSSLTTSDATLGWYLRILYAPWGHWWFLYTLFVVSILYLLVYIVFKGNKYALAVSGIILYSLAILVEGTRVPFFILTLYIFFVLGDLFSKNLLNRQLTKLANSWPILMLSFLIAVAGEYTLLQPEFQNSLVLHLIFAITGSIFTLLLAIKLATSKVKSLEFIRTLGQHSLYIYLLHVPIEASLRIFLVKILGYSEPYPVVAITYIVGLVTPIFLYRIMVMGKLGFLFIAPNSGKNNPQAFKAA
jgi:fucose 4-O-acetylase-like acetyltransferase